MESEDRGTKAATSPSAVGVAKDPKVPKDPKDSKGSKEAKDAKESKSGAKDGPKPSPLATTNGKQPAPQPVTYSGELHIELEDERLLLTPPTSEFKCWGCQALVWNCQVPPCFHLACKGCVDSWYHGEPSAKCPSCKEVYARSQWVPLSKSNPAHTFIIRSLYGLKIKCPEYQHMGCKKVMEYSEAASHLEKTCEWSVTECGFCKKRYRTQDMARHGEECKSLVKCKDCKVTYVSDARAEHEHTCPKRMVDCPNGCKQTVVREMLAEHRDACPNEPIRCRIPFCSAPPVPRHSYHTHLSDQALHVRSAQRRIGTASGAPSGNGVGPPTAVPNGNSPNGDPVTTSSGAGAGTSGAGPRTSASSSSVLERMTGAACELASRLYQLEEAARRFPVWLCEKKHIMRLSVADPSEMADRPICCSCGEDMNPRETYYACTVCAFFVCSSCVNEKAKREDGKTRNEHWALNGMRPPMDLPPNLLGAGLGLGLGPGGRMFLDGMGGMAIAIPNGRPHPRSHDMQSVGDAWAHANPRVPQSSTTRPSGGSRSSNASASSALEAFFRTIVSPPNPPPR